MALSKRTMSKTKPAYKLHWSQTATPDKKTAKATPKKRG